MTGGPEVDGTQTSGDVRRRAVDGRMVGLLAIAALVAIVLTRGGHDTSTGAPDPTSTTTSSPEIVTESPGVGSRSLGDARTIAPLRAVEPTFDLATSFVVVDPATGATAWWWLDPTAEATKGIEVGALQRATIDASGRWLAGRVVDPDTGRQSVVAYADVGARIEVAEGASISRVVWDNTEPGVLWWAGRDPSLLERVDLQTTVPTRSELRLGRPLPHGPPVPEATAVVTDRWKLTGTNGSDGGPTLTILDLESGAEVTVRLPGLPGPDFELLDLAIRT